jgi:disulfide bond formation protein DsbB
MMSREISIAAIAAAFLGVVVAGCQSPNEGVGGGQAAPDKAHGQQIFTVICATCHGIDGSGIKGLGKSFVTSEYVRKASDDQLVDLLTKGRDAKDPLNSTGVVMPPKGGNPSLSEKDLRDVVAYVRTLNHPS